MGEVIRFVPKSERERLRLIREARANYDSIFPPAAPVSEAPAVHAIGGADVYRSDGLCRDQHHRRALQSFCSGKLPRADRDHIRLR